MDNPLRAFEEFAKLMAPSQEAQELLKRMAPSQELTRWAAKFEEFAKLMESYYPAAKTPLDTMKNAREAIRREMAVFEKITLERRLRRNPIGFIWAT